MSVSLRIVNGCVYDPANEVDGETKTICIQDGKIVADVEDACEIDAQGMVMIPGGYRYPLPHRRSQG